MKIVQIYEVMNNFGVKCGYGRGLYGFMQQWYGVETMQNRLDSSGMAEWFK